MADNCSVEGNIWTICSAQRVRGVFAKRAQYDGDFAYKIPIWRTPPIAGLITHQHLRWCCSYCRGLYAIKVQNMLAIINTSERARGVKVGAVMSQFTWDSVSAIHKTPINYV